MATSLRTRTEHELPFERLSPRDFERLCYGLVRREGYAEAEHLGAAGRDKGQDIRAVRDGRNIVFQCKRVRQFEPKDAQQAVDKVLASPIDPKPDELILLVSCDVSAETRKQASSKALPMACSVWSLTELDERVRRYPALVFQFWGIRVFKRLRPLALGAFLLMLISVLLPPVRNKVVGPVVILPIRPTVQSPAALSQYITSKLATTITRKSGIAAIGPEIVAPIAATLPGANITCLKPASLEQIRRFTRASFVISGSFDTFEDGSPRAITVCLQGTWDSNSRPLTWLRQELVRGAGDHTLKEVANSIAAEMDIPPWIAVRSRQRVYTANLDAVQRYFEGMLHFQRYELKEALASFRSAMAEDPNFHQAHYACSRLWRELGRDQEAQDEARQALTLFDRLPLKDELERALLNAYVLETQGKLDLAIHLYQVLWSRFPSDSILALRLVEGLNFGRRGSAALAVIHKLRGQKVPELPLEIDARLYIEEGIAENRRGRSDLQEIAAKRALDKLSPNQDFLKARAQYLLCDALVSKDNSWPSVCQEAEKHFMKVNDLISYAKFRQLVARRTLNLQGSDNIKEALFIDRTVTQIFSKEGFRRGYFDQIANLAGSLLEQDPPLVDEAERVCREGIMEAKKERSLSLPAILINCAELPMMERRFTEAAEAYLAARGIAQERGDAMLEAAATGNLAYAEHALGRSEEALLLYERSLQISSQFNERGREFGFRLIRYARLLSDLGRADEARTFFEQGKRGTTPEGLSAFLESMAYILGIDPPGWKQIVSAHPYT